MSHTNYNTGEACDCDGSDDLIGHVQEARPMTDLREQIVEAMAETLHDHGPGRSGKPPSKDWRDCFNADAHGGAARKLVDSVADALDDERVEACYRYGLDFESMERLIAALRDTGGE